MAASQQDVEDVREMVSGKAITMENPEEEGKTLIDDKLVNNWAAGLTLSSFGDFV